MTNRQDPPQAQPAPEHQAREKQDIQDRVGSTEMIGLILSVLWLGGVAVFFFSALSAEEEAGSGTAVQMFMVILAVFLPIALIWVGVIAARSSRVMREESLRLQTAIDTIRHAFVLQNRNRDGLKEPSVTQKLDEIAVAQRKTETALAMFSSSRPSGGPAQAARTSESEGDDTSDQVPLPLGTPAEDLLPPLEKADFIRALNFPETPEDKEGFAALRRALKDRPTALLIQASQDILTLMSHDGIYMDDLRPEMARPEIWRRFAAGDRGRSIAALGGVRDRSSLALTAARMKKDAVFRDAAHHFLRLFDQMFTRFSETADDTDIAELSNTRTARAFMLLGRVAHTFD